MNARLRQAERADGRLADRPGITCIATSSRSPPAARSISVPRACGRQTARDDDFGDVQYSATSSRRRCRSRVRDPNAADVVVTAAPGLQGRTASAIRRADDADGAARDEQVPGGGGRSAPAGPVSEQDQWAAQRQGLVGSACSVGSTSRVSALSLTPCVRNACDTCWRASSRARCVSTRRGFPTVFFVLRSRPSPPPTPGPVRWPHSPAVGGSALFQKPWIITLFAGLFAVSALSMFGLFELQTLNMADEQVRSSAPP